MRLRIRGWRLCGGGCGGESGKFVVLGVCVFVFIQILRLGISVWRGGGCFVVYALQISILATIVSGEGNRFYVHFAPADRALVAGP